jgi:chromosome partitioning protein
MIITVAHTKGGVGKSTLAWNLAHSFLELGKETSIVDLDFQQTLFFLNSMNEEKRIEVIQPQSVAELLELTLTNTKSNYSDVFIIDVGGFDNDINRAAIDIANIVLIPLSNSITEVIGFKTFEAILEESNILGEKEVFILLNNIHPSTTNFSVISNAIGDNYTILDSVVRSRKAYRDTMGTGESVFNSFHFKPQQEIRSVRDEILRHHNDKKTNQTEVL